MKTKEEILIEFGCPDVPFDENVTMYYPAILSAMDEYANAKVDEAMRWRDPKEELPEYKGEYFQILLKNPNGIYFLREIFSQDNIDYLLLVEGDYCVWRPIE